MRLPWIHTSPLRPPPAAPPRTAATPLFDEVFLARLRRLVLLSGRARAEGVAGEHRSKRRGSSPEFADFKSYSQGDDFRRIDWNTYARLNGVFVRLSEVTTELSVHVLIDVSDSMDWRSRAGAPTKLTYGLRIAGALGYVALWHFDRLALAPFGETLGHMFGPSQGRANIVPMLRYLEGQHSLGRTALMAAIDRYGRARRRPGLMVIISDLLSGEPNEFRDLLRWLRGRGWQVAVIHVLDEAELAPAAASGYLTADAPAGLARPPIELLETETGERLRLSPNDELLRRYGEVVGAWLTDVETGCSDEQATYVRLLTTWDFEDVVLGLLHQRGVVA